MIISLISVGVTGDQTLIGSSPNCGLMVINSEKSADKEKSDDIDANASETDTYTVSYLDPIQL